jgi:hypothetical protein
MPAVFGGGLGVFIASAAQNLEPGHPYRGWLISLAPGIAVGVTAVARFVDGGFRRWSKRRQMRQAIADVERMLKSRIDDPATSEEHRADCRNRLTLLAEAQIEARTSRVHRLLREGAD